MTRLGFMITSTSRRALRATGDLRLTQTKTAPITDFAMIEAVESQSILGKHDGTLPDDLMELLEGNAA